MPIEVLIKKGDAAAESKDFLTAISRYTEALSENPAAFAPLIKRAQTYTKLCDYDSAKADISKAFTVSESRGRMADKATCYFRLGLVNYSEKQYSQAYTNLQWAKKLHSSEPALDIWIEKARRDCVKNGIDPEGISVSEVKSENPVPEVKSENSVPEVKSENSVPEVKSENSVPEVKSENSVPEVKSENSVPEVKSDPKSTSLHTLNQQAPIKTKIRDEWYQSKDRVTITIYAANVAPETVQVHFSARSVSVAFPTSASSEYNYSLERLAGEIVPEKCSYSVMSKKLELVLVKAAASKWSGLEGEESTAAAASTSDSAPAYPSSSRKKTDWAKFDVADEDTEGNPEDFFAKLYKDVDEDTRRAMMKSYVESNGTVLTTNWNEAKDKQFDTRPPDGMEARKW